MSQMQHCKWHETIRASWQAAKQIIVPGWFVLLTLLILVPLAFWFVVVKP